MSEMLRSYALRLRHDARGLTTVEYTIVLCLIAALCVGTWKIFGDNVNGYIVKATSDIANNMPGAAPGTTSQ